MPNQTCYPRIISNAAIWCILEGMLSYSTAQRHCPLTQRPEPARALIVNI